jgi:hypothetical protein
VQLILVKTILAEGESVAFHRLGANRFVISGRRRATETGAARENFTAVNLTDGSYLYIFYDTYIGGNKKLITAATKLTYQFDADGHSPLFRLEHSRIPESRYPFAHLHVEGQWLHAPADWKPLPKIHFPVLRPTLEGVIRLLVYEFDLPTNTEQSIWGPILDCTEGEFLKKATIRASAPPVGD